MATGKDAGNETVAGKKDNAQGSPRNVDKSPNQPMTDDNAPSTKAKDNAPNATDAQGDALSNADQEAKDAAYEWGKDLDEVEGKKVDEDSDEYKHAQLLVGEDLAYINTVTKGQEVTKYVYATSAGSAKLK